MALTITNMRYGVDVKGRRTVNFTGAFSDGSAATVLATSTGLRRVDEAWVQCVASAGQSIDITANTEGTSIVLDPTGAITSEIRLVGYE